MRRPARSQSVSRLSRLPLQIALTALLCAPVLTPLALTAADAPPPDKRLELAREALADRDYPAAIRALRDLLVADPPASTGETEFGRYLLGVAQALAGDAPAAAAAFQDFAVKHPASPWRAKAAFRLADALAKQGKFAEAVAIYEPAAARLASADRRQEIADLYGKFAEPAWNEAEKLAAAKNATDADRQKATGLYAKAAALYVKAVEAGLKPEREPDVQLRIARCQLATNDFAGAAARLAAEKKNHPKSPVADQVAYYLGLARFSAGELAEARRAFQDFLADFPQSPLAAQAAYRIGLTFGLPSPAGPGWLELGVKAHRDFVTRYPQDPLAPKADFEIAQSYFNSRLLDDAIRELSAFIAKYQTEERAAEVPLARNSLGACHRLQKHFDEATRVWQEFLKAHPTHKDWSAVQRQILDLEYEVGVDLYAQKNYPAAKEAWQRFLDAHPLDPRCPETLFALGQIEHDRKEWQAAIDAWQRLVSKYPGTEPSSHAQFQIAYTLEMDLHRFADALEAYKKTTWGGYAAQAQARIQEMEAKKLLVLTERAFRSDEAPGLKVTTRNMEKLTLRIYKLDLESYFRKMRSLRGVETLDISLIKPDQTSEVPVPGYEKYREQEWNLALPVKGEGAWAINVGDESFEATTLVVVTDLGIVTKSTRREVFVFAEDLLLKKARGGAKVLVTDGAKVIAEGVTDENGIFRKDLDELKTAGEARVFALAGGSAASDEMSLGGVALAGGLEPRGFVFTDRPGYRPGDAVRVRGILRRVEGGAYAFAESEEYDVQIVAPTGEALRTQSAKLSSAGALELEHKLDPATPLGTYRVVVSRKNGPTFSGSFEVQDYPIERIGLALALDRDVLYRGETLAGTIRATYFYGEPVSGRLVRYRVGDQPERTGTTDAKGEIRFEVSTRDFAESQPVGIAAAMDEEGIAANATVFVSTTGFAANISTVRSVFLVGEPFEATVSAIDPAGKPVEVADMKLTVVRIEGDGDRTAEKEVQSAAAATAKADGKARASFTLEKGGRYILRARGTDRFGNAVVAFRDLFISGDDDTTKVRILADHDEYKVGDEPKVRVVSRANRNLALVTYEGERIYRYQVIDLAQGETALPLAMTDDLAPNFVLAISTMDGNAFHSAAKEFLVVRGLTIKLKPSKEKAAPGEEIAVEVETTDPLGRPVSAEISLAMVDEGLFAVAPDALPSITEYFYGQRRGVQVSTATSCTWRHEAKTVAAVPELLEELKRMEELRQREREFERMRDRARRDVARVGDGHGATSTPNPQTVTTFGASFNGEDQAGYAFQDASLYQTALGQSRSSVNDPGGTIELGIAGSNDDWNTLAFEGHVEAVVPTGTRHTIYRVGNGGTLELDANKLHFMNRRQLDQLRASGQQQEGTIGRLSRGDMPNQPAGQAGQQGFLGVQGTGKGRFLALGKGRSGLFAGPGPLAAIVRAHFPDTGYWNASIMTGKDGKATVKFALPGNTTSWRLTAYGATRETLVGKGGASLTARKDFFVDLKLPDVLVEGDKPRVQARVVNGTDRKLSAEVKFRGELGSRGYERTTHVDVEPHATAELEFEFPVPSGAETGDAREARFTVTATATGGGDESDLLTRTVEVEPWGTELRRGIGGIASDDRTEFIELPAKDFARRTLRILLGGSPDRALLDLAGVELGDQPASSRDVASFGRGGSYAPRGSAASEGLTLLAVLDYLDATGRGNPGDRRRLEARLFALAEGLAVTQNDDGGWPWSAAARNVRASEPHASADAIRFLSGLKRKGYPLPTKTLPAAVAYLKGSFAAAPVDDTKAILLFALAHEDAADFAFVNRLYRDRNRLSTYSLALLSLTFNRMGRTELAAEIAAMVEGREPGAGVAHPTDREAKVCLWIDDDVEARAYAVLALQAARPQSPRVQEGIDWLLAHRWGARWPSAKGTAAAAVALATHLAKTQTAGQRYALEVRVNGTSVKKLAVDAPTAASAVIDVPANLLIAGRNKLEFDLEGQGRYAFSAVFSGFTRELDDEAYDRHVAVRRKVIPAPLTLDGREIARGYSVLTGSYEAFDNPVTQLAAGQFVQVELSVNRLHTTEGYLVLEEYLPAGASVLPGTVSGDFDAYEARDGRLLFWLGDRRDWATIRYRLGGSLPGEYRVRPARAWSVY
ncbi:MAG: tetratricopeptide repeat protein, partial [Planctomycetes bacterium]|nr:tetratricopeptide repeat protein [Planctomycetota bacterium]